MIALRCVGKPVDIQCRRSLSRQSRPSHEMVVQVNTDHVEDPGLNEQFLSEAIHNGRRLTCVSIWSSRLVGCIGRRLTGTMNKGNSLSVSLLDPTIHSLPPASGAEKLSAQLIVNQCNQASPTSHHDEP